MAKNNPQSPHFILPKTPAIIVTRYTRADVVIFNGTSTVYEIKSEYDSFAKLSTQLEDYRMIFDRICVVVPPSLVDRALKSVSADVGVFIVTQNLGIKKKRIPSSNKHLTVPARIFDCMRRVEYEGAIKEITGSIPDVPNARRFMACKEIFTSLPPHLAHDLMVRHIRQRANSLEIEKILSDIPESLAHVCLTLSGSKVFIERAVRVLNQPLGCHRSVQNQPAAVDSKPATVLFDLDGI